MMPPPAIPSEMKLKRKEKNEEKEDKASKKISMSHYVERCIECKSAELVINHVEGTIVC
jgi:hypothetical protein